MDLYKIKKGTLELIEVILIKDRKENTSTKSEKVSKLTKEDGQSEKLEEKRINVKKGFKPLFSKDVNDPSEGVHD